VLDAGGVDDPGHALEPRLVEVGDGDVEGLLVEQGGELFLVEVLIDLAAAQRHVGDRADPRARGDADAAQRRDHAAACRLGEVEARGLGGEEIGDVAGDQRAGRGHADEGRADPVADAAARLLAERGVGLVADHDRVGVGDATGVAHEPLVGLDRHRAVGVIGAVEQGRREPLLVPAVGDLADELVDEVAAVGEDQHASRARGLDEADGGDGLAGAGGVLEPKAAAGARILFGLGDDVLVGGLGLLPVLGLLVGFERVLVVELGRAVHGGQLAGRLAVGLRLAVLGRAVGLAVAARLAVGALELGRDRGQRAGERVDLVFVEGRAVEQLGLLIPEQALEAEQQGVVLAPLERWHLGATLELGQRIVDGPAAGGPRLEVGDRLVLEQDGLSGELPDSVEVGLAQLAGCASGNVSGIGHQ
jgi:hypothetical protein